MTVPMNTTFSGHTTDGAHDKLFNFTGPRSRQWAKKRDAPRGLTALIPGNKKVAVATPLGTPAGPAPAEVLQPAPAQLPLPAPVVATAPPIPAAQGPDSKKIAEAFWKHSADPEDLSAPWNRDPHTLLADQGYGPESMTPSTGFGDAQRYQRLMPYMERLKGNPQALEAFVLANGINQDYVKKYLESSGSPQDTSWWNNFRLNPLRDTLDEKNLAAGYNAALGKAINETTAQLVAQGIPESMAAILGERMARQAVGSPEDFARSVAARTSEVGGMGPGSLAQWLWFGGAPLAMAAKGLEVANGDSVLAAAGDPEAQQRLQLITEGRLQRDAAQNTFGSGLGDVIGGAFSGGFGGQGSWDQGTAQMAAGVEKLRTMGTAQNRINLENLRKRNEATRTIEAARIGGTPTLAQGYGRAQDYENAKERFAEKTLKLDPGAREAWTQFQQANEAPYRNYATLDPIFGETSAVQSGRLSRRWSPSQLGNVIKDWLTGGDTSHEHMMKGEDSYFDEPGAGRYEPYRKAVKNFQKGNYDIRNTDISGMQLSDPGKEYGVYNPLGLFGLRKGQRAGAMDPADFRKQWDAKQGDMLDKGMLSAKDISATRANMNQGQIKALDWERRVRDNWAKNRGRGDSAMSFGENSWAKTSAENWVKTAVPEWYRPYEDKETARSGYSLEDFYQYQNELRKRMFLDKTRGRTTGSGMSAEEEDYGQGLWERWNKYDTGRHAKNYYAPFGGLFSQRDRRALDPVLRDQRKAVLGGNWRPGMQIEPLIEGSGIGLTNWLGPLGARLGLTQDAGSRKSELGKAQVRSSEYKKLEADLASGKLSLRDFFYQIRGTPALEYSPTYSDSLHKGLVSGARNQMRQFSELIRDADTQLDSEAPPYAVATRG